MPRPQGLKARAEARRGNGTGDQASIVSELGQPLTLRQVAAVNGCSLGPFADVDS